MPLLHAQEAQKHQNIQEGESVLLMHAQAAQKHQYIQGQIGQYWLYYSYKFMQSRIDISSCTFVRILYPIVVEEKNLKNKILKLNDYAGFDG